MPDAREYPSVLADAEAAAKRGDFVTAEAWLREGLPLQEAALGAAHPDVASSLNNLAVICESTGRLDEAERLFRRAYDVATAAAAQARPGAEKILATSRENLRDFCVEHGRPFDDHGDAAWGLRDQAPAAPAAPARPAQPPPTVTPPPRAARSAPSAPAPTATPALAGPRATTALPRTIAVVTVAVLAATLGWRWLRADDAGARTPASPGVTAHSAAAPIDARPAPAPPEARTSPPAAVAAPPAGVPSSAPPAASSAPLEAPATVATPPAGARPAAEAPLPPAATTAAAPGLDAPRVMTADLCASLETGGRVWRCAPVDTPAAPGRLSFVTRIASPRGARLQHRWSREGDVRQSVRLSVAASPTEGYRTFSRQTVTPGAWSVAVLDADGVVLQELRFEVRAP